MFSEARDAFGEWFYMENGIYVQDATKIFNDFSVKAMCNNFMSGFKAGQTNRDELLRECYTLVRSFSTQCVDPVDITALAIILQPKLKEALNDKTD